MVTNYLCNSKIEVNEPKIKNNRVIKTREQSKNYKVSLTNLLIYGTAP